MYDEIHRYICIFLLSGIILKKASLTPLFSPFKLDFGLSWSKEKMKKETKYDVLIELGLLVSEWSFISLYLWSFDLLVLILPFPVDIAIVSWWIVYFAASGNWG